MPCTPSWERGVRTSLDSCKPTLNTANTCNKFSSTEIQAGVWTNCSASLNLNEYMVVTVDATNFVSRVVVDDAVTVGT